MTVSSTGETTTAAQKITRPGCEDSLVPVTCATKRYICYDVFRSFFTQDDGTMCHCEQTCVIAVNDVDKTNKKQLIIIDQTKIVNLRIFSSKSYCIVKSIILSNNRGGVSCAFCDLVYGHEFAPIGRRKERGRERRR